MSAALLSAALAVLAAAQTAASGALPPEVDPRIPSREVHSIEASCRGRPISVRYTVSRPGPDLFETIAIGGMALSAEQIGLLNRMLAGYMLDGVQLYSCEGEGAAYELKLNLLFSRGEERHIYLIGIRGGRVRLIR